MNLLLLLSALLSALTGVGGQARAPQVAAAVQVATEQTVEKAVSIAAARPAIALPRLLASSIMPQSMVLSLAASEPIFARSRRE